MLTKQEQKQVEIISESHVELEGNKFKIGGRLSPFSKDPDICYKSLHLIILSLSLIMTLVGFIFVLYSIRTNTKSVTASVHNSILTHVSNLDRLMIEKPYLYPYFFESKVLKPEDKHYIEVRSAAFLFLDVFDVVGIQSTKFKDDWPDAVTWDRWIIDMFKQSPVLRDLFEEEKNWYREPLTSLLNTAEKELIDEK